MQRFAAGNAFKGIDFEAVETKQPAAMGQAKAKASDTSAPASKASSLTGLSAQPSNVDDQQRSEADIESEIESEIASEIESDVDSMSDDDDGQLRPQNSIIYDYSP